MLQVRPCSMDSTAPAPRAFGSAPFLTLLALGILLASTAAVLCLAFARCRGPSPKAPEGVESLAARCHAVPGIPGPEDLEVDTSQGTARLLVSSQDRRANPLPGGAIFVVGIAGEGLRPRAMPLVARDQCSFHPHGLSLVHSGNETLLYVVNHHDLSDASAGHGCLAAGIETNQSPSSIEIFRVEAARLVFLRRLADPAVLIHPNDLVALPDGTVWATSPVPSPLDQAQELLTGENRGSRLVRFRCSAGTGPSCRGEWTALAAFGTYLNGIAYRAEPASLFVASTLEGRLYRLDLDQNLDETLAPHWQATLPGPDNLSWDGRGHLLVAGHPDLRRFLQNAVSASSRSPSSVSRVDVDTGTVESRFQDDGNFFSAASVAVRAGDQIFLGQVFAPFLLRCSDPPGGPP